MSQYAWVQSNRGEGGQSWRNKDSGGDRDMITFSIPDRTVGKVIGRGGSKIRELQEQSGARIKIGKESTRSGEKEIELQGSDSACQTARMLIEEIVNGDYGGSSGGGASYGGGGGGSGMSDSGCFKCGQGGHISRDCPSGMSYGGRGGSGGGGGGGGGARGPCYKCGEGGHISRNCPK